MEYGKISYVISVVIDREDPFNNLFQYPLTILQNYNLNMSPELMTPLVHEDMKHFCCWFCRSAPVLYTFIIPYGGYAPGQKIQYIMKINNQSTYDVYGFEVNLRQKTKFQSQVPQKKERVLENNVSHSLQKESVLRLSRKVFTGLLDIPSVPPSSRNEGIISVRYFVSGYIDMGECHMDAEFEIPIVIGTSPFPQREEDISISQLFETENSGTPNSVSSDQPPNYDKCKPPNYEEATQFGRHFIDTDVDDQNRRDDFLPRYPMFLPTAPPPPPEDEILSLLQPDADRPRDGGSLEASNDTAKPYGWSVSS
ncbi:arrestin domain-containing protein 3-like [Drosophila bipectinata]|uniref:arrestin domain-containing protein 3-like n=1 Tax=Drosophila bipectinata TaxID=42026 RepID=UPI0038B2DD0E